MVAVVEAYLMEITKMKRNIKFTEEEVASTTEGEGALKIEGEVALITEVEVNSEGVEAFIVISNQEVVSEKEGSIIPMS